MADPNILRVGAEFDVAPLIEGTQEAIASFDELQAAYEQIAATAEIAGDSYTQTAANLMAEGIAAQDVEQNLVRFGASQAQAAAAVQLVQQSLIQQIPALNQQAVSTATSTATTQAQTAAQTGATTATSKQAVAITATLGPTAQHTAQTQLSNVATTQQSVVTGQASGQVAALQNQINQLNRAIAQLQQQLAGAQTNTRGFAGSMGEARVAAGALTDSTGMVVGGMARIAAQSKILGPILAAAFPIFAIIAFIEIASMAIAKLNEWAEMARKAADAQAEFDREVTKSLNAFDESRAKIAGLSSSNAELAEKTAHSGEKVLDLSEHVKKLNERIEDTSQGYFKRLKEGLGIVTVAIEESIGVIDEQQHNLEEWNSKLAQNYGHQKDLSVAIQEVNEQIKILQTTETQTKEGGGDNRAVKELQDRIGLMAKFRDQLIAQQEVNNSTLLSDQIRSDERLIEEHSKTLRARAQAEETAARSELRAHAITLEEERTLMLDAETKRKTAEESIQSEKLSNLRKEASAGIITQQARIAGEREISASLTSIEIESATRRKEINDSTDQAILRRMVSTGEALIENTHKITEAQIKLDEERAKREFEDADTVHTVETATQDMVKASTASYKDQIQSLQQRAALLESTLQINKGTKEQPFIGQAVTADLGSEDFKKQIEQIRTLDEQKYNTLVAFDAQVRTLETKEINDREAREREGAEKIKRIRAEELETSLTAIRENLAKEESLYHEDIAHLEELHDQKKLTLREYTQAAIMFAQEEYAARAATLQQETDRLKIARDQDLITEEQYAKKVEALHAQLAKFQEEKEKQVTEFQKQEIAKREQAMAAATKKITDEFVQGINKMIQGQQSLSRTVAQTAGQIVLHLVDQGIERVVTHYGEEFAKLIAQHTQFITQFISDHSTFLATLLGIETTSDAKKLAQTIASNTTQITSDAGLSFAAGFASVMEALPFPENVEAAPEVAAAAAAQTEAGAFAFEKGGIVPEPKFHFDAGGVVPAYLHAGEMVLPKHISSAIQTAVPAISNFNRSATNNQFNAGASQGAVTKTMHNNINLKIENRGGGGIDHDAIIASVKKGIRLGSLNFD